MIAQELKSIQTIFIECFKESAIFNPQDPSGGYFQANDVRKDNKHWLVVAAGIEKREAKELFRGHRKRAEKSLSPLRVVHKGEASILFVVRPSPDNSLPARSLSILPFAPSRGIPAIEVHHAYIRLWDLPENKHQLSDIRWEWDIAQAQEPPLEKWLRPWKEALGFNPAHPPSHLHVNTERIDPDKSSRTNPGEKADELRLSVGNINPLAFILGIAAWLRTTSS